MGGSPDHELYRWYMANMIEIFEFGIFEFDGWVPREFYRWCVTNMICLYDVILIRYCCHSFLL